VREESEFQREVRATLRSIQSTLESLTKTTRLHDAYIAETRMLIMKNVSDALSDLDHRVGDLEDERGHAR